MVTINNSKVLGFVSQQEIEALKPAVKQSIEWLFDGTGKGNDFLGWVTLPSSITAADLNEIKAAAKVLRDTCDVVIAIGIGGSYLGTKAVTEALKSSFDLFDTDRKDPVLIYAGQNISGDYAYELQQLIKKRNVGAIVISKSGTTTEPAIAFRYIKEMIEAQYGKAEAQKRIVAVTDKSRGALRDLATQEGYKTFVIPDNVGGRFSVLTPVGLLPLAVAGIDIEALAEGAREMEKACGKDVPYEKNVAAQYAAVRNALYRKGKKIELLASFEPKLQYFAEWWKQLYGESEGKEGKGIFPASVIFSTDLHSMGQYIQEGERILFETVITPEQPVNDIVIAEDKDNLDKLNFLAGKKISEVNRMAELGVMLAHVDGGVPNINIRIPKLDEKSLGQLIYFFEMACGISGYILGVNPFNQPGVEAYKANMFALLGKPGYEEEGEKLRARL